MQERRNSSALAMELRLSCTNPSICLLHLNLIFEYFGEKCANALELRLSCSKPIDISHNPPVKANVWGVSCEFRVSSTHCVFILYQAMCCCIDHLTVTWCLTGDCVKKGIIQGTADPDFWHVLLIGPRKFIFQLLICHLGSVSVQWYFFSGITIN